MIIGLTGGIGSGKSTASNHIKNKGYFIVDADKIARNITIKGSDVLQQLVVAFGSGILDEEGNLQRQKLGKLCFENKGNKAKLDGITHPAIKGIIKKSLKANENEKLIFLDAPLLFETGLDRDVDIVWAIITDDKTRIKRVSDRDGLKPDDVKARINTQLSQDEMLKRADEVIYNKGNKEELYKKLDELFIKYE